MNLQNVINVDGSFSRKTFGSALSYWSYWEACRVLIKLGEVFQITVKCTTSLSCLPQHRKQCQVFTSGTVGQRSVNKTCRPYSHEAPRFFRVAKIDVDEEINRVGPQQQRS